MAWCYTCGDPFESSATAHTDVCLEGHIILCDDPWPDDPDRDYPVRCAELVHHEGSHCGPNGPSWPRKRVVRITVEGSP
jgi:hypothetical protein